MSIELCLCLMISLVMVAFPFFDLLTVSVRYALVTNACMTAVREATAAPSFVEDQVNSRSAVHVADDYVRYYCKNFSGIAVQSISTSVQPQPLDPDDPPEPELTAALSQAELNTDRYLYQYRVKVIADVEPLITYNGTLFSRLPGLTEPLQVVCTAERVCEKPETLIK